MESLFNYLNPRLRRDVRPVGGRDLDEIEYEERRRTASMAKTLAFVAAAVMFGALAAVSLAGRANTPNVRMNRLVVAPFDNRTGNPALDQLGNIAAEILTRAHLASDTTQIIPSTTTMAYEAVAQLSPKLSDYERALQLGRDLHAGFVIWGAYYIRNDSLQLSVQMTNTRTGEIFDDVTPPVLPPVPTNELAAREAFERGMRSYVRGDWVSAARSFAAAAHLDSALAIAHVWQARALSESGDLRASDSVAYHMLRQRLPVDPYSAALLNHTIARNAHNHDVAYTVSAQMSKLAPGSDEARRLHAADALALGFPRQARAVLEGIDPGRGWMPSWPPYFLELATAYHAFENHGAELRILRTTASRYARSVEVQLAECRAYAALHKVSAARIAALEIMRAPASSRIHPVSAVVRCAEDLMTHGEVAGAQFLFVSAFAAFATSNPDSLPRAVRADMAEALFMRGGHASFEAVRAWLGNPDSPAAEARLAYYAAAYGRRAEARAIDNRLEILPDSVITPDLLFERAKAAAALGDVQGAWTLIGDALQHGFPYFDPYRTTLHDEFAFRELRKYPAFGRLLRPRG